MVLPVGSISSRQPTPRELALSIFIASNRPLDEYNLVSFLHAILCYHKSTDSVTFSIDSGVASVRKYIKSMRRRRNSTAIKRMRERLKQGPFSSSSGLGMRLSLPMEAVQILDTKADNGLFDDQEAV